MGGWAEGAKHQRTLRLRREDELRRVLALFPDRAAYEAWITKSQIDDAHRAHLERFLPASLRAQGTV